MAALAFVRPAAVLILASACAAARAAEAEPQLAAEPHPAVESHSTAEPHPATPRIVCLSASETRDEVKAHKLLEPFAALKSAAQQRKAEPLSAKLCHIGDEFIYEITLLHRDGRLTHVQMEAGTGKLIPRPPRGPREIREPHEPREPREPPVKN